MHYRRLRIWKYGFTLLKPLISSVITLLFILPTNVYANEKSNRPLSTGIVKGQVINTDTKSPLNGVSVIVVGTGTGAITDSAGNFIIANLPVGNCRFRFSHIGYETLLKEDIVVNPDKIAFLNIGLKQGLIRGKDINVTAGYFIFKEQQPVSALNFSGKEISQIAGSAGDVSRAISSLPSISKYDDRFNNLIVRGGNHLENGYFVDGFEIPNIDHYPAQTGGGGAVGLLNMSLIRELNFYTGGFPASYGDKISSFMDITFREGNHDEFDGQVEMSLVGLGATVEGPIANGKGSWLLSGRRGYMDIVLNLIDVDLAPKNYDIHNKLVYNITPNNKISFLGITGGSKIDFMEENEINLGSNTHGFMDVTQSNTGIKWQCIWSSVGYSSLSFSYNRMKYNFSDRWNTTDNLAHFYDIKRSIYCLKNDNRYKLNEFIRFEFGMNLKYIAPHFDYFLSQVWYGPSYIIPELTVSFHEKVRKTAAYVSVVSRPISRLLITTGVRADYFSFNHNHHLSPRFSFSYKLGVRTTLNGMAGVYYQSIPMLILSQYDKYRNLSDIKAYHFILGFNHLFSNDIKLTAEIYDKEYYHAPIDTEKFPLFTLDRLIFLYGSFLNFPYVISDGRAFSRGFELSIQKKLSRRLSGIIGGSYSSAKYKGYDDIWRNRVTDNRVIISIEGSYELGGSFKANLRWDYAGGVPYTPYDTAASAISGTGIPDANRVNAVRRSDYHSLSIRIDKRFYFRRSNLALYLSIWNLYNRKNVAICRWDVEDNKSKNIYQLSILPIIGFEYKF